jgi:hypothetical protein
MLRCETALKLQPLAQDATFLGGSEGKRWCRSPAVDMEPIADSLFQEKKAVAGLRTTTSMTRWTVGKFVEELQRTNAESAIALFVGNRQGMGR